MSDKKNFKIIYHFLLLNDIVLFGKVYDDYFICTLTKHKQNKKENDMIYIQSASRIYIRNNDYSHYCIQVSLFSAKNELNKPFKKWVLEVFKKYAPPIYINIKKYNSKIIIIEENKKKFSYNLYDIPNYIWCVATGMILAKI